HGATQHLDGMRSIFDLSSEVGIRTDDILGLHPNGLLVRWAQFGTARTGGGAYERSFLLLSLFGPDGLVTRQELFAMDSVVAALARFNELTGEIEATSLPPALPARRVRPNAATASSARFETAITAQDADAFPTFFAEDYQAINHITGSEYGRE